MAFTREYQNPLSSHILTYNGFYSTPLSGTLVRLDLITCHIYSVSMKSFIVRVYLTYIESKFSAKYTDKDQVDLGGGMGYRAIGTRDAASQT